VLLYCPALVIKDRVTVCIGNVHHVAKNPATCQR